MGALVKVGAYEIGVGQPKVKEKELRGLNDCLEVD